MNVQKQWMTLGLVLLIGTANLQGQLSECQSKGYTSYYFNNTLCCNPNSTNECCNSQQCGVTMDSEQLSATM